jgi:hypothetical protein
MGLKIDSKYYDAYYEQVLENKRATGNIAKIFDIINDLSDRRGIKNEWNNIDGDIQDEIIEKWTKIIS